MCESVTSVEVILAFLSLLLMIIWAAEKMRSNSLRRKLQTCQRSNRYLRENLNTKSALFDALKSFTEE